MCALANQSVFVKTPNCIVQRAPLHGHKLDLRCDMHADRGGGYMAHIDMRSNSALAIFKQIPHRQRAGLFDEADHHCRGEYRRHADETGPVGCHVRHSCAPTTCEASNCRPVRRADEVLIAVQSAC